MRIPILDSGQKIVSDGLVLNLDAAQLRSYPGSGTTWTDLSGSGNDGTLTNGPTFDSGNGGSIVFDGTNDQVRLPATNIILSSMPNGHTLECWFKSTKTTASRIINTSRDSGGSVFSLLILSGGAGAGSVAFQYRNSTNTATIAIAYASGGLNDNNWHHMVGSVSSSTGGVLYVDNVSRGTNTTNTLTTAGSFRSIIGSTPAGTSEFFSGNIAIVRIYNRPLSATEVGQNYNAQKSRFGL